MTFPVVVIFVVFIDYDAGDCSGRGSFLQVAITPKMGQVLFEGSSLNARDSISDKWLN